MRKSLFLLFPLFLLLPLLLIIFVSPSLLGTFAQALTQSQQGGLGGAYGATSYTLSGSVDPSGPAASVQPKIYGGSGPGGSCLGTSGAGNDIVKMDFGWSASYLNKKWQDYPSYRLCNDHYTWETATDLPAQTVFQTLQWPSDLLTLRYANQVIALGPLSSFDANTQQAQQQQQQNTQQNQSTGACDWVPNLIFVHPHIDICAPIRLLVHAGSVSIRTIYQKATAQINFLWQTPLQPFQDDKASGLLSVWSTSWAIVLVSITVVIAYGALRYMIGSAVNWLAYANITELIPRLLFGLLAAYFSKQFFIMLIQANNALSGVFNQNSLDTVINGNATGVIDESLQIVYGLMGFLLIIEEAARIAIIYLLFAFAPILFFFAALRETQRWAKAAAVGAIIFIFLQAIQSATLDVGGQVLSSILHNTDGQLGFLNLLVSLAILYLTLTLFFSLARMALGAGAGPFTAGVARTFAFSSRLGAATGGMVGQTAGRYRQARTNLFPLPGPAGKTPGSPGSFNGRTSGGSSGSGNNKPGNPGNNNNRPGNPGGNNNKPGGPGNNNNRPGNPGGNNNRPSGPGNNNNRPGNPGSSRTPLNTQVRTNNASPRSGSPSSGGRGPTNNQGQWQKAPPRRLPQSPIDPDEA